MSDLELTMMRRVGELNKENARLKEAIADSYKAVDEMEKRFKELEAEFEMHPMAVENARLKAEVERLTKAGEWQPIETAPKDMTRVLGYVEEYIVVMWWFTYSNGRSCWETVDGESEVDPTHWMPLPKPPQEGKPSV